MNSIKPWCDLPRPVRLAQLKAERDRSKTEMKDLQHQLSEMHDELDQAKNTEDSNADKEVLLKVSTIWEIDRKLLNQDEFK